MEVSRTFNVSRANISHITNGRTWPDIPWPDGSTGPISLLRTEQLRAEQGKSLGHQNRDPHHQEIVAAIQESLSHYENDNEFLDAIAKKGSNNELRTSESTQELRIAWSRIKEAPEASEILLLYQEDPLIKEAAERVLATTPQNQWLDEGTIAIIKNLAKQYGQAQRGMA